MHLMGRGRYARETYPSGPNAALVALTNRYLIDPDSQPTPAPFTALAPTTHAIAGVNVTRRASGIFMVSIQMPFTLAAADTAAFTGAVFFGSVLSGGTPSGAWLIDSGVPLALTPSVPTGGSIVGGDTMQLAAGNLKQTAIIVGVNAKPLPVGVPGVVVFAATTDLGTQITPGSFFGVAYELP